MRYMAIDYGSKRLGLAMCDPEQTLVSPLCRLHHDPGRPHQSVSQIQKLIAEHQVEALVVGLPLNMDGSEGEQARQTRVFADQLLRIIDLPLHFQDERLSSAAADELLDQMELTSKQRRERRDALAACDILQDFLEVSRMSNNE